MYPNNLKIRDKDFIQSGFVVEANKYNIINNNSVNLSPY